LSKIAQRGRAPRSWGADARRLAGAELADVLARPSAAGEAMPALDQPFDRHGLAADRRDREPGDAVPRQCRDAGTARRAGDRGTAGEEVARSSLRGLRQPQDPHPDLPPMGEGARRALAGSELVYSARSTTSASWSEIAVPLPSTAATVCAPDASTLRVKSQ